MEVDAATAADALVVLTDYLLGYEPAGTLEGIANLIVDEIVGIEDIVTLLGCEMQTIVGNLELDKSSFLGYSDVNRATDGIGNERGEDILEEVLHHYLITEE